MRGTITRISCFGFVGFLGILPQHGVAEEKVQIEAHVASIRRSLGAAGEYVQQVVESLQPDLDGLQKVCKQSRESARRHVETVNKEMSQAIPDVVRASGQRIRDLAQRNGMSPDESRDEIDRIATSAKMAIDNIEAIGRKVRTARDALDQQIGKVSSAEANSHRLFKTIKQIADEGLQAQTKATKTCDQISNDLKQGHLANARKRLNATIEVEKQVHRLAMQVVHQALDIRKQIASTQQELEELPTKTKALSDLTSDLPSFPFRPDTSTLKKPPRKVFASAAHFPHHEYGQHGETIEHAGAVIYEDMTLLFNASGGCELSLQVETPNVPVELRLQVQFLPKGQSRWSTITFAPMRFLPEKGERPLDARRTVRQYTTSVQSHDVQRFFNDLDDALFRRHGTARFGYGSATRGLAAR